MTTLPRIATAAALALSTLAATAPAQAQGRLDWRAGEYRLVGNGVPLLYPELRGHPRGRAFVMRNFDWNGDGRVSIREADAANAAFARAAGPRRDRFDWGGRGGAVVADERVGPAPRWGRAMHDYRFRQTPRGATFSLAEEVLFATDSARLRPGAIDRLRGLADYLGDQRGVRIAIDGHTDARGTAAHNLDLSRRRAAAVADALIGLGLTRARLGVEGFGESRPVASNATAAGQRQNRRVEITLLGRRAAEFARY